MEQNAFSDGQISAVIAVFWARAKSLTASLRADTPDVMGTRSGTETLLYHMLHSLWLLLGNRTDWAPAQDDRQAVSAILLTCRQVNIRHYGLESIWSRWSEETERQIESIEECLCADNSNRSEWCRP